MNLKFTECELTNEDFSKVEEILLIELPAPIKKHYKCCNGGRPSRTLVNDADEVFGFEIKDFIPLLYCKDFGDDPDFTLEGRTLQRWNNVY